MRVTCCVINCDSKSPSDTAKQRTLFAVPQENLDERKKWLDAISSHLKKGRRSRVNLYVCDLHFKDGDVERNYSFALKDGSTHTTPRQPFRLAPGCVPCVFNNHQCSPLGDIEILDMDEPMDRDIENLSTVEGHINTDIACKEDSDAEYNIAALKNDLKVSQISNDWSHSNVAIGVEFYYYDDDPLCPSKMFLVKEDMSLEMRVKDRLIPNPIEKICSFADIMSLIVTVTQLYTGQGCDDETPCPRSFSEATVKTSHQRCESCLEECKRKSNEETKTIKQIAITQSNNERVQKNLKRRCVRSQEDNSFMQEDILKLKAQCAGTCELSLEKSMKNMSKMQQEAIRTCLAAAKCNTPNEIRCLHSWILECLMIRIKSRQVYLHLRNQNILQVPTIDTLNKYLKKMKPSFGFAEVTFELLQTKGLEMRPEERRGTLVLDEMKFSEEESFDRETLKFRGFTDLGQYTPNNQEDVEGDHVLVFMYQPFRGNWVQTIGSFLSKGCANSTILHQLVLECIILLENAGFRVDVVTTDGAPWNRLMWKKFGLEGYDTSCEHPYPDRGHEDDHDSEDLPGIERLHFRSDFSHLANLFRNFIMTSDENWTPDGVIKKAHFRAILECDRSLHGLEIVQKLTPDHLDSKYYRKMNVGMAFDIFSPNVAAAMTIHKKHHDELHDCDATINFINRFHRVIVAMTSRSPHDALSYSSQNYKTIMDFCQYLEDWHHVVLEKGHFFMSASTYHIFQVTLNTTIEVMFFLTKHYGYKNLMTSRLNQDALEGFFEIIYDTCGSSDQSDSLLFIQVYRLLNFYSLVKPPRGSYVEGTQIFEALLNSRATDSGLNDNKAQWKSILDKIIEHEDNKSKQYDVIDAHDYNLVGVNDYVQAFVFGFVTRKIVKWTSCSMCLSSVSKSQADSQRDEMIDYLSKGYLRYPSETLFNLLSAVESAILEIVGDGELKCYAFLHIANNILAGNTSFVGCPDHQESLTKITISYYAVSRARILGKFYNKMYKKIINEAQEYRERVKLGQGAKLNKE